MSFCTTCGHRLGDVAYCTSCGARVPGRVDAPAPPPGDAPADAAPGHRSPFADEPPIVAPPSHRATAVSPPDGAPTPTTPPATENWPPGARYPLFADELADQQAPAPSRAATYDDGPTTLRAAILTPPPDTLDETPAPRRGGAWAPWVPWVIVAICLVLVMGAGAWLLIGGGGEQPSAAASTASGSDTSPRPEVSARPSPSPSPSPSDSGSPSRTGDPGKPVDVARSAKASATSTAPPNQDVDGNQVRYVAANVLDGQPDTCWRAPGDATGVVLTLRLAAPTTLTSVGLINGYAKTAYAGSRPLDWYQGNRRVTGVTWSFDDGTSVSQGFRTTRRLQSIDIDPVTTSTVTITITGVTAPGKGPAARNYTPISDVSLVGTTTG